MKRAVWLGLLLAVGAQLASVGLLLTSGWLIVRAAQEPPVLYLMVAIVGVRFFGIGRAALRYAERLVTHDAALGRAITDRVAAYRALRRGGVAAWGGRRSGDVVRRVVSDVERVQDGYLRVRVPWVAAMATWFVVVAVIAIIDVFAAGVLTAQGIVTLAVLRLLVHRLSPDEGGDAVDARGALAADLTEIVRAAPDLVACGAAPAHRAAAERAVAALARSDRRGAWAAGFGQAVVLGVGAAAAAACLMLTDRPAPALVAVVALAPLAVLDVFLAVAEAERLRPAVAAARRRLSALHETQTVLPVPAHSVAPQGFAVAARGLVVGWPGHAAVAENIDLDVPEGAVVAITAPSGAGKTTLALTLTRQLPAQAGTVSVGGVDLADVDPASAHRLVGLMGQDEVVLDTTLRENLRIGRPDASDDDLTDALQAAGLGGLLASSGDGLDLMVGEQGNRLSGGERQRLALARLLLAGHRVLVLDEPTEHLDAEAADHLIDDVLALAPRCSVIVLTHSPAVLARVPIVTSLGGGHSTESHHPTLVGADATE